MSHAPATSRCSFCKKTQDEVRKLISSRDAEDRAVFICDECVDLCNGIIFGDGPSLRYGLWMVWCSVRAWMLGRWPRDEERPPASTGA
jgi:hypothetical protein